MSRSSTIPSARTSKRTTKKRSKTGKKVLKRIQRKDLTNSSSSENKLHSLEKDLWELISTQSSLGYWEKSSTYSSLTIQCQKERHCCTRKLILTDNKPETLRSSLRCITRFFRNFYQLKSLFLPIESKRWTFLSRKVSMTLNGTLKILIHSSTLQWTL